MTVLLRYPLLIFVLSFILLWIAAWLGATVLRRKVDPGEGVRQDFSVVLAATLTLLGLILGFSFSMAINRYDQRKNLEEEEANAIGTEYLRVTLLPAADAAQARTLLKEYLEQRIAFYTTRDLDEYNKIVARTSQIQDALWSAVASPAKAQPTPIAALALTGMNDVINSQGYTQAAWWNRIPVTAWILMLVIAVASNLLVGSGARQFKAERTLLLVLPFVIAVTFMLIADIDSPRGGLIIVQPQNLQSLQESLRAQ
ncbi:MAG TPA: hypothetical protein PLW68_09220 [Casimicrobiaceae bacterium]|nr:hypothetical protein [Casimicrobiaceae bacterium]